MPQPKRFGPVQWTGGKRIAWRVMGQRTAVAERQWIGGAGWFHNDRRRGRRSHGFRADGNAGRCPHPMEGLPTLLSRT
jgi:hypothetical protein